jgi:hypothetical protein
VSRMAFTPKNWTFQWKPSSPLYFIIISTIYNFWGFELYKITNIFYYWLCCKFNSKVIMFQEALQFCLAIVLYYSKETIVWVIGRVPPPLTWHIFHIIVDCLSPIVFVCVFNQSYQHWLLNDALHFTISMSLKLKEENKINFSFESLLEDNSIISDELFLLASNIERR